MCIPVESVTSRDLDDVLRSLCQFLAALSRNWYAAQLRVKMSGGANQPFAAEWQIEASDEVTAREVATQVATIGTATIVGIRFGEPHKAKVLQEWTAPVADLVASRRSRVDFVRWDSPAWHAVLTDSVRWTLMIDLDALPFGSTEVDDSDAGIFSTYPEALSPSTVIPGLRLVGCRVRLSADSPSPTAPAICALFSEDSRGPYGLQSKAASSTRAPLSWMPDSLVAHLLAAPARLGTSFPSKPLPAVRIFESIEAAGPHVVILGKSGQGKTVLQANLAERAASLGEAGFVVDVHDGWLALQADASARRHGQDPVFADFSDRRHAPFVNLAEAPPGVDRRGWAEDLFDLARNVLHADEPVEHFGKVGNRMLGALIKVPVLDPHREVRLEDMPPLLTDVSLDAKRRAVLDRIGDDELTAIIEREVLPLLRQRDPGSSAGWLFSGLQPLISCWAFRSTRRNAADALCIEEAVESGRPFILHAPAAELGDVGSRILVTVALHRLWLATRRHLDPAPRHVLVDEWQNYPSPTIEAQLSQGRKYRLKMRLSNQNMAQIPSRLRDSALGNAGAVICFRLGPGDANLVDGLFPKIHKSTLQTLPKHTFAATVGDIDFVTAAPPPPIEG